VTTNAIRLNGYRRDHVKIMGGYVDVDPAEYADFTAGWVAAAAIALRPGASSPSSGPHRTGVVPAWLSAPQRQSA
jgi:hypothetical protein